MHYKKIDSCDILYFKKIIRSENVLYDKDTLNDFSSDHTEDLIFLPEIVLKPESSKDVSLIMKYCNSKKIPVTPSGARTGLSGGSLPVFGGVSLSLEKMNKILEIDKKNLQATVEPGLINEEFKKKLISEDLFYPPDPASMGSCMLGGNVAENAGGPKALKYGVTKDYVLNLEIVLPTGELIWTGANVLKNATGYNLTQLLIGSEGTLGVITKIVFKVIPLPKNDLTMLIPFKSAEKACQAVSFIFRNHIFPSALEFMEKEAIDWTCKFTDADLKLNEEIQAVLLLELDGNEKKDLIIESEKVYKLMQEFNCGEILFAESKREKDKLWEVRRLVGHAVKDNSIYKEEDTVVPRANLPKLLNGVKTIGKKYNFKSICYGHAGDGNLHVNIIKNSMNELDWNDNLKFAIREIFILVKRLGGTISGEHGIGYVQREYMDIMFCNKSLNIQKEIKKIFDPNSIMNPGKIFPDSMN